MKDKRIRMYLIFWFDGKAPEAYKKSSAYGVTKCGDEFLQFAYVEKISRKYVNFDDVLQEFIENCKKEHTLIKQLVDEVNGTFNIEIVPEMSVYSSTPAIILDRELIDFINSLGDKFGHIEFDTYII